jgi:hypothetical protein
MSAHSQDNNQGPRFIWAVGFLALGTLSAIGAAALFPWYLAIAVAVLVVGLASACAFQFRATHNPLYLVAMCLMTALAAFLDGVSVWELLNEGHNSGLHASRAVEGAVGDRLASMERQVETVRAEIASLNQEVGVMDNDGKKENDSLIPGKLAYIESRKADLANLQARVDELQKESMAAATTAAVTDKQRHILLQLADEHEHPERWLITCASVVFLIPEFTLALLAWSLHGGARRRDESLVPQPALAAESVALPAHAAMLPMSAQWLVHQQHLHALHAQSMAHPLMYGGMVPAPAAPATEAPAPAASSGWDGPAINPIAARVAEAERAQASRTVVSSAAQTVIRTETAPEATVPAPMVSLAQTSPVAVAETGSEEEEVSSAEIENAPNPLAVSGGHPGLLHHAPPFEEASPVGGPAKVAPGAPGNSGGGSWLQDAKRKSQPGSKASFTRSAKLSAKKKRARNLAELAARLN